MKFLSVVLFCVFSASNVFAGFCSERANLIQKIAAESNFQKNLKDLVSNHTKLYILGEPHETYYLGLIPDVIDMLDQDFKCAFVEMPFTTEQNEFVDLVGGENTKHFQTQESFEYVNMYRYFIQNEIKIIPVDARYSRPEGLEFAKWMTKRDDIMFSGISSNIEKCESSVFIVGKHHITSDLAQYENTLGQRLKRAFPGEVQAIDMLHSKNYYEDYCSYSENKLFSEPKLFPTKGLEELSYGRSSQSSWADFDYILYLPKP